MKYGVIYSYYVYLWSVHFYQLVFLNFQLFLGMAVISLSFGLAHAFDCDHIACIDNMTRKLVQEGGKTRGAGFFFSLGHSTVVMLMGIATIFAVNWAKDAIPKFQAIGGVIRYCLFQPYSFLFLLSLTL